MATDAPKVALITGITGQDGSYLAELLLEKGYTVSMYEFHLPTAIVMITRIIDEKYPHVSHPLVSIQVFERSMTLFYFNDTTKFIIWSQLVDGNLFQLRILNY
jgi:nucleoside-diphosphate-sugar epimerase